jgi:hypothetical protein
VRRFAVIALLAVACNRLPTEPLPSLPATLAGRVYVLESGSGMAHSRVVVSGAASAETSTDETGMFRMDGLPAGIYSVAIAPPSGNGITLPVNVRSGANWLEVPLSTGDCGIYYGFVIDAKSGRPVAGATVSLVNQTTTNALGWYTLVVGCPPRFIGSSVLVAYEHPGYKPYQRLLIMAPRHSTGLSDVLLEPQ